MAKKNDASTSDGAPEGEGWEKHGSDLLKLEEGAAVRGIYRGKAQFETADSRNGIIKNVNTYRIEKPDGSVVKLMGLTQLDEQFAEIKPGTEVFVKRQENQKTAGGKRTMFRFDVRSRKPDRAEKQS